MAYVPFQNCKLIYTVNHNHNPAHKPKCNSVLYLSHPRWSINMYCYILPVISILILLGFSRSQMRMRLSMCLHVVKICKCLVTHWTHMVSRLQVDIYNMSLAGMLVIILWLTQQTLVSAIPCQCHVFFSLYLKHTETEASELNCMKTKYTLVKMNNIH